MFVNNISYIWGAYISKSKRCYNAKPTDIDICISVPLREFFLIFNEIFKAFKINDSQDM